MARKLQSAWIIRRPLITEKAVGLMERRNVVQFVVDRAATKPLIKRAVENLFSVRVKKVRVANVLGKRKVYRFQRGQRSDVKKAYVELFSGEKISLLDQVGQG